MTAMMAGDSPPSRSDQIRHLFLSWLYLLRSISYANRPGQMTWDGMIARPEMFLSGVTHLWVETRESMGLQMPPPVPPYVPDRPIAADEVKILLRDLMEGGVVGWRESTIGEAMRMSNRLARRVLVLTEDGVQAAEQDIARFDDQQRLSLVRVALLRWIGVHSRSERRAQTQYLNEFLGTQASVAGGIATTMAEATEILGWLSTAGFLSLTIDLAHDTIDLLPGLVVGRLTQRGHLCVQEYGCDPVATPVYQGPAPDHRVYISGGNIGNIATHSSAVTQAVGHVGGHILDLAALTRFVEATAQAVPVLGLPAIQQEAATAIISEIRTLSTGDDPDRSKLHALGRTLRTILEGAATSALASGLISLWTG